MSKKEEKIPDEVVRAIHQLVDGDKNPATFEYLLRYGVGSGIPEFDVKTEGITPEEIYAYCLENDVRWEDVLERMPDDVLT